MSNEIIKIQNLSLCLSGKKILNNISMTVEKNSITALVGYNGAGKSTLIKALLGLENDYSGSIILFDSEKLEKMRSRIGAALDIDNIKFNPLIKGRDYLKEVCYLCGESPETEIPRVAKILDAVGYIDKKISAYSYGMKQRLSVAAALIGKPELLILDEPFNGIDAEGITKMRMLIKRLHKEGVTVLLTSHIITELTKLATDFLIISGGRLNCKVSRSDLDKALIKKRIYKTDNQEYMLDKLKRKYPDVFLLPYETDYISVIGNQADLLSEFSGESYEENALAEEILLLYMSGKDQGNEEITTC